MPYNVFLLLYIRGLFRYTRSDSKHLKQGGEGTLYVSHEGCTGPVLTAITRQPLILRGYAKAITARQCRGYNPLLAQAARRMQKCHSSQGHLSEKYRNYRAALTLRMKVGLIILFNLLTCLRDGLRFIIFDHVCIDIDARF